MVSWGSRSRSEISRVPMAITPYSSVVSCDLRGGTVRYYFESGSVRESTIGWLCFEETFLNLKFRWLEGLRVPGDRRTHFVRFRMGIGRCNCTVERVCPGPSGLGSFSSSR